MDLMAISGIFGAIPTGWYSYDVGMKAHVVLGWPPIIVLALSTLLMLPALFKAIDEIFRSHCSTTPKSNTNIEINVGKEWLESRSSFRYDVQVNTDGSLPSNEDVENKNQNLLHEAIHKSAHLRSPSFKQDPDKLMSPIPTTAHNEDFYLTKL